MRDEQGKSKTNLFYFYYPFFIVFYFSIFKNIFGRTCYEQRYRNCVRFDLLRLCNFLVGVM